MKSLFTLSLLTLATAASGQSDLQKIGRGLKDWGRTIQKTTEDARRTIETVQNTAAALTGRHPGTKLNSRYLYETPTRPAPAPNTTRYGIAPNLLVDVPGTYPPGFAPKWDYVGEAKQITVQSEQFVAAHTLFPTDNRGMSIGEYEGRAVLVFDVFGRGDYCVADIAVLRAPAVLSADPQTFRLTNFRNFENGQATQGLQENGQYTGGGVDGEVTLSADRNGNLDMDFMIENYGLPSRTNPASPVTYRYSVNRKVLPNKMTAADAKSAYTAKRKAEIADSIASIPNAADLAREAQKEGLYCYVDANAGEAQMNAALMQFLRSKYPGKENSNCMSRRTESVPMTRQVPRYDPQAHQDFYVEEHYTEITTVLRNNCNKNVRIMGFSVGGVGKNGKRQFGLNTKVMRANYRYSFPRASDNLAGDMIASILFGGGMLADLDLRGIERGGTFDIDEANISAVQYMRAIEEEVFPATVNSRGERVLEVASTVGPTGILVKKGDRVYLSAAGYISTGTWSGMTGPEGHEGQEHLSIYSIAPNIRHGALMVKVGKGGAWQVVGRDMNFTAPASDQLYLAVNDKDVDNNNGIFTVVCGVNKPLAAGGQR